MKLSIVIPTYNRAKKLSLSLDVIKKQLDKSIYLDNVDIIISDNASSDETGILVKEWIKKNSHLNAKYYKNKQNFGYDRNVYLALKRSNAHFSWLLSDDDDLIHGAIDFVFKRLLLNQHIVFCFVNYKIKTKKEIYDSNCSIKNTILIDGDQLPILTYFSFSLCSSCIFNNSILRQFNTEKYIGTNWYHMFIIRDILPTGKSLLIGEYQILMSGSSSSIKESRYEKRLEDPNSYDFYFMAHLNFVKFANSLGSYGFSKNTVISAKKFSWNNNLRQILYFKYSSPRYKLNELIYFVKIMSNYFCHKPLFWLIHIPLVFMPATICSPIYIFLSIVYKTIKKFNKV